MKIDTLGVQAFVAIADNSSFQLAADSLYLSQTGVTRRLQNLEQYLGVKLIERTTRSVSLTDIGRDFLPQARRLLHELESSLCEIRETGKSQRGNVSIACVPTAGVRFLPRIIQEYSAQYPNNSIKILDHSSADVLNAVMKREAEFGINIAGAYQTEQNDICSSVLLEDKFIFVCRDDHPLANRKQLTWKHLEPHPIISIGQFSGNRPLLDRAFGSDNYLFKSSYEVQRVSTALGLVAEGVGAAVLPSLAILKDAYPRIIKIALNQPQISRTLVLVSRKNAVFSPAAGALYDMIQKMVKLKHAL